MLYGVRVPQTSEEIKERTRTEEVSGTNITFRNGLDSNP